MDALHQLEILWMVFFQSITSWLAEPMKLVSMLGQEDFYMLVMPALYWCFDAVLGFRVGVMLLLTYGLNTVFKLAFLSPRPYWLSEQIHAYAAEVSFGLPSGHAQNAASIWGLLAASLQGKAVRIVLGILIFLIGFSRIVLGVHFISDVVAGWAIGLALLFIYLSAEKAVTAWLKSLNLAQMLAWALATTLLIAGSILIMRSIHGSWVLPEIWQQNAETAYPGNILDPLSLNDAFTVSGTWLGLLAGAAWLFHRQGGFHAAGSPSQRLLRYFVGAAGILILWFGLGKVFPRNADALSYGLRFFRYILVGIWVSAAAPLVFQYLKLAERK